MCLPLRIYDDWEKFNETSLPKIIDFNSYLNIEDITDPDYVYVHSNTISLADVFEGFQNMCIEIYGLDHAKFLSTSGLARFSNCY